MKIALFILRSLPDLDKGYGVAKGAQLKKVVEMFDPFGKVVTDPSLASRTITSYYDEDGKLVKRVLGKAVILRPAEENSRDD